MNPNQCQFPSLPNISEGMTSMPPQTPSKRLKIFIRRNVNNDTDRKMHRLYNTIIGWFSKVNRDSNIVADAHGVHTEPLQAGDVVRVRSIEEIAATLNHIGQLKGCSFMDAQEQYCGTVQRVLKSMERFVDERDLRVKKCKGLVLLEGVMCEGTTDFGRCDRCCFMFWREEWLEKISE